MCISRFVLYATLSAVLLWSLFGVSQASALLSKNTPLVSHVQHLQTSSTTLASLRAPRLVEPQWLKNQVAAEQEIQRQAQAVKRVVTYSVMTRGVLTANVAEFKAQALATLNDNRGWTRMGVLFQEVDSGGMFTLVLSEASQMTSFSSTGCDSDYSCRVGEYVIINQDRWLGATASWNTAGGSMRDYRHMVINHETGHWLGHGHISECGPRGFARVMQQQSIDLRGCSFNPWPIDDELWSTQLGITLL